MITKTILLSAIMLASASTTMTAQRTPSSSMSIVAASRGSVPVRFKTDGKLSEYSIPEEPVKWGLDVAWDWDVNVLRGTNFIGKDVLKVGRVSFQPAVMKDETTLSSWQINNLQTRLNHIAMSGVTDIVLNCDHEVLMNKETYPDCDKNYAAYCGHPEQWYNVIKATVSYCQAKGFRVITVSPFNESDYGWSQYKYSGGTPSVTVQTTTGIPSFKAIAKLIYEDPFFNGIRISGGNTLNCDRASAWYSGLKPYVTEGNTHQLAGSMSTYTKFWETVRADGNYATADELHNTMEAFIGIHHGMQTGIWWGFDAACRGEFCKASAYGKEIGYAEDANTWTGAAVYKWNRKKKSTSEETEERINAFAGASERQAKPQTYNFISTDRPVYFEGHGPVYSYQQYIPGDPDGKYNGPGQKNAERMLQVLYGEDVPLDDISNGNFIISNMKVKYTLSTDNASIITRNYNTTSNPPVTSQWTIEPAPVDGGGDFGYFKLHNTGTTDGKYLDVSSEWGADSKGLRYATPWAQSGRNLWFFEYAGNNSWYIRNRYTGMYLQPTATTAKSAVQMVPFTGEDIQKWRFFPVNTADLSKTGKLEFNAPQKPVGLTATQQPASILLSWTENTDADLDGYNILRAKASAPSVASVASAPSVASGSVEGGVSAFASAPSADQWDVIGRVVKGTQFIDNDVEDGVSYTYKVKAVDRSRNQSEASDAVVAQGKVKKGLLARYTFEENVNDSTANEFDAVVTGTQKYVKREDSKTGTSSLLFSGDTYLTLPPSLGDMREMTICGWVYNSSYSTNWTRIFDFGNGTNQYFFFTPNGDGNAKVVMKNGGAEQTLTVSKDKFTTGWHYIAVTLSESEVKLYIDSQEYVSTTIRIRPADFKPTLNYIGASQYAADPLFRGYIDDLRIYNYPLSAAEVATLKLGKELPTGDANRDGKVTVDDANMVMNYVLGDTSLGIDINAVDMNLDEKITADDAKAIIEKYLTE